MLVPRLEKQMGIEVYATRSLGIGGVIRRSIEDFAVEEVLVDGSKATIEQSTRLARLGSSFAESRFLLCILAKRNWDTISAVKAVADNLGIGVDRIQFAGLKDTRAITAQHVTIEGVSSDEAERVHVKDIEIRPVGYIRTELSSYYLLGNSFRITISAIDHPESIVRKRIARTMEELEQVGGPPNFFGHQRFGTIRPITHQVGKAIVKDNFEKAAMLFLAKPSPDEHSMSRRAREALQASGDFKRALQDFPKQLRYERILLRHLVEEPHDFVGALRRLPLRLLELFPQAYQSYLFNRFLSRRLTQGFSLNEVEVGDYAVNVERSGLPLLAMNKTVSSESVVSINKLIQTGKMRLAIPLLGYKHKRPCGLQGEIEKEVLDAEDISASSFKINAIPEVSLRGKLRTALAPLKDFSLNETAVDLIDPTKHKGNMSFTLSRGSYATIVLRELMKQRSLIKAGF